MVYMWANCTFKEKMPIILSSNMCLFYRNNGEADHNESHSTVIEIDDNNVTEKGDEEFVDQKSFKKS